MLADWILRLIGDDPAQFGPNTNKWAIIFAFLTDLLVPYGQIVAFLVPFGLLWVVPQWRLTMKTVLSAVIIGGLLAYGVYLLDDWLLLWGQDAAFRAIYER